MDDDLMESIRSRRSAADGLRDRADRGRGDRDRPDRPDSSRFGGGGVDDARDRIRKARDAAGSAGSRDRDRDYLRDLPPDVSARMRDMPRKRTASFTHNMTSGFVVVVQLLAHSLFCWFLCRSWC